MRINSVEVPEMVIVSEGNTLYQFRFIDELSSSTEKLLTEISSNDKLCTFWYCGADLEIDTNCAQITYLGSNQFYLEIL